MQIFANTVGQKRHLSFPNYQSLHRWSVENPEEFWSDAWDELGFIANVGKQLRDKYAAKPKPTQNNELE